MVWYQIIKSHMRPFIMIIYIAPLQGDYSGALSIPVRLKRNVFYERKNSSRKSYSTIAAEASVLGVGGRDPQILAWWGRGWGVKYYYILSFYRKYVRKW